jgi:hypothetical protein
MALPSRYYKSPEFAAIYNDRYKNGCPSCGNSKMLKDGMWYCRKGVKGYPKLGKGECEDYRRKK